MSDAEITKSAAVRSNLLTLQRQQDLLERTQERLSTGKEINDALDGPQEFFASQNLDQRSSDLLRLKDSMGQGVSTIEAANDAVGSIEKLLDQAQGLAQSALSNLDDTPEAREKRAQLAEDFNSLKQQIDEISEDASYQGKNLTLGSGRELGVTNESVNKVNNLAGLSATRATNISAENQYRMGLTGNGKIEGNSADIAKAEKNRGLSNIRINGLQSKQAGSFEDIKINVEGGEGADKTITVTEGDESRTVTFDRDELKVKDGVFFHKFQSGTSVQFRVDLQKMENVPNTAGTGTSVIEKNTDLKMDVRDANGFERVRDASNPRGFNKLKDGENAFAFDDATVRTTIDENTVMQSSSFETTISEAYGPTGDVLVGKPTTTQTSTISLGQQATYEIQVQNTSTAGFNYETGNFKAYDVRLVAETAGGTVTSDTQTITESGSASGIQFSFGGGNPHPDTVSMDFNYSRLREMAVEDFGTNNEISQATGGEVRDTVEHISGPMTTIDPTAVSGDWRDNLASSLDVTVNSPDQEGGGVGNSTVVVNDGLGGTDSFEVDLSGSGTLTKTINIDGGPNDGASVDIRLEKGEAVADSSSSFNFQVRGDFTGPGAAQFDIRPSQSADSETLKTEQQAQGSDQNDLRVDFNQERTNFIKVQSINLQTEGVGLGLDEAMNSWRDRGDIEQAIDDIKQARSRVRTASSSFSTNLNILKTREEYTKNFTNTLQTGSDKLTLADQKKEGVNLTTIQTRQQIATRTLSIANQSQQSILQLFGG